MPDIPVRMKDNPLLRVRVNEARYRELLAADLILPAYDPDAPVPQWPDFSQTYIQAPDIHRDRHESASIPITEEGN